MHSGLALCASLSQSLFATLALALALMGTEILYYAPAIVFGLGSFLAILSSQMRSKCVLVATVIAQIPCMLVAIWLVYVVAGEQTRELDCKSCELLMGMLMFASLTEGTLSFVVIVYACRKLWLQDEDREEHFIISSKMSWESLKLLENSTQFPVQPTSKNIDPYYYSEDII